MSRRVRAVLTPLECQTSLNEEFVQLGLARVDEQDWTRPELYPVLKEAEEVAYSQRLNTWGR